MLSVLILALVAQTVPPGISEEIVVERIVIDAHITNHRGTPIIGLEPADLHARIGGRDAEIEAVDWIPATELAYQEATEADLAQTDFEGRTIVIFFQRDVQRWSSRVLGHMRMIDHVTEFVERLSPADRVAVVSFDSHLKLEQDFTRDLARVGRLVEDSLLMDEPDSQAQDVSLSLFAHIDNEEAESAAALEEGLLVVAKALDQLPGPKSLIFFGYGFGEFGSNGTGMPSEYEEIRELFERSRTSVFTLDTTDADFHTLENGLRIVAEESGGYYVKTHNFPQIAIDQLERTLSGRYEIVLKRPAGLRKDRKHRVSLVLGGIRGHIWSKRRWIG